MNAMKTSTNRGQSSLASGLQALGERKGILSEVLGSLESILGLVDPTAPSRKKASSTSKKASGNNNHTLRERHRCHVKRGGCNENIHADSTQTRSRSRLQRSIKGQSSSKPPRASAAARPNRAIHPVPSSPSPRAKPHALTREALIFHTINLETMQDDKHEDAFSPLHQILECDVVGSPEWPKTKPNGNEKLATKAFPFKPPFVELSAAERIMHLRAIDPFYVGGTEEERKNRHRRAKEFRELDMALSVAMSSAQSPSQQQNSRSRSLRMTPRRLRAWEISGFGGVGNISKSQKSL